MPALSLPFATKTPMEARPRHLPTYAVRRSPRARAPRLTYDPRFGLTVVVPARYDDRRIEALVAENLGWVDRARGRLGPQRAIDLERDGPLPRKLSLRALGVEWAIRYTTAGRHVHVEVTGRHELTIRGTSAGVPHSAQQALADWLTVEARRSFEPALAELAGLLEVQERLRAVHIRVQRSRWGSCSARGNVSLNRNLLFLPASLARLVLIHEACHLRELNHSPRFWALLHVHEPNADGLRRELRDAWRYVPAWAEPAAQ